MLGDRRESLTKTDLDRAKSLMVQLKQKGMLNSEIAELSGWSESSVKGYTKGVGTKDPEPWRSAAAMFSEMLSKNLSFNDVRGALGLIKTIDSLGTSLNEVCGFMDRLVGKNTSLDDIERALCLIEEIEAEETSLDKVCGFIDSLMEKNISLAQVAEAIELNAKLCKIGTSSSEVADFIKELKQQNIDTASFISVFSDWKDAGFNAKDARLALSYKESLKGVGFDIEALPQIADAAGKFGSPPEVLDAVTKYGTLRQLDEDLETKGEELENLAAEIESHSKELTAVSQRLEKVRNETVALEKVLATYERLVAIGFGEKALGELSKAVGKYGRPSEVLSAVNSFAALSDIKASHEGIQLKVQKETTTLENLRAKHSHLKSAIDMCQKLLDEHKFGLDVISTILSTAGRYGEPIEVLRAVEAYGKVVALNEKIEQLKLEVVKIEGKIEQLKKTQSQYGSRNKTILDQFEALNAKAIEVGRTVGAVEQQLKKDTMARDILNLLQNPVSAGYEDYLSLVLVLLNSIRLWTDTNKNQFAYFALLERNLKDAMGHIGGS